MAECFAWENSEATSHLMASCVIHSDRVLALPTLSLRQKKKGFLNLMTPTVYIKF